MTKRELADRILAMLDTQEWEELESGSTRVPVNPYNREVLLHLRETADELTGDTDGERAGEIEEKVRHLLDGNDTLTDAYVRERFVRGGEEVHTELIGIPKTED